MFEVEEAQGIGKDLGNVARAVISEDSADCDLSICKPSHGTAKELAGGLTSFIIEDFHIGETRIVIDCDVNELPADASSTFCLVAGNPVTNSPNLAELLDI